LEHQHLLASLQKLGCYLQAAAQFRSSQQVFGLISTAAFTIEKQQQNFEVLPPDQTEGWEPLE